MRVNLKCAHQARPLPDEWGPREAAHSAVLEGRRPPADLLL